MKLLIDIPDEQYEVIKRSDKNIFAEVSSKECMLYAIKNGIPVYEHEKLKGEWIFRQGVTCGGYYKCNICGEVERAEKNFCPNCGADMRGEENE